ncbi:MAG: SDR family NAD(P)-dependent oxidoreductase [Thermoleophilia bacterium]
MGNRYDFGGRVAAVTGGASGIGRACAGLLADGGATVAVLDLDEAAATRTAAELGGGAIGVQVDVADPARVNEAVARVERELGRLDVLVCSAGVGGDSLRTADVPDDEWRRVMAINCDGTFWCNRAVVPGMLDRGYGRIVNIASIAGKEGNPMATAYSASKAAVIGMTKAIGKDVAGTGVLVNCIAPAVIRTPILEQLSQEHVDYMVARIPLGRLGEVEEVARLVCFLASEDMTFSTGATFDISGGRATY